MHADVQNYINAQETYSTKRRELLAERERIVTEAHNAYAGQIALAQEERDAATEALANSSDPLVAWIAKIPMRNYPDHAMEVLKALPATREELDSLAQHNGWCSDWERYLDRAEQAGVLPAGPQRTDAYRELVTYVTQNWGGETGRKIKGMLSTAIRAEIEAVMASEKAATEAEQDAK